MANTWKESLRKQLTDAYGQKKASSLINKYVDIFPPSYIDEYTIHTALEDISYFEKLNATHPLEINFYRNPTDNSLHLRLLQWQKPSALSDILPMLENFNLRTESEHPTKLTLANNELIWISDFYVDYTQTSLDLTKSKDLFKEAFANTYFGHAENDGFNKLVLAALLSWREITVLRTYAKYLRQIGFRFSQTYIENALVTHANIANTLIEYFKVLHTPGNLAKADQKAKDIENKIITALEHVKSLDEDTIIRRMLILIKATLRTNYYQTLPSGEHKPYLSIKLSSRSLPDMPLPIPLYEIFVYSPRFEGIHLRNAKVARGGIRWSDRREDFRTEILGLMKAQTVKNAIIVPSGAKGGFVLKTSPKDRTALQQEVIACYQSFIRGLLDLTDNIVANKYVRPEKVLCHDDPDTYLVVAADKGTASFSDIANAISAEYHFWLGDAFASGGKTGYDHKKMGITARGAWESIKRHFHELNIDPTRIDFTVVGIGDMSGDVFGNGMLYSKRIKLVAAFDHRNIFIDPNPNPTTSYNERARLFKIPLSSWEDYNPKLISKGGGIFKRSDKSIAITPQMKEVLGITANTLTPNDLVRAILKAPVDLLFNGGIGTYVKASTQSNADVGDRTNDYCRVDGSELRCKIVGEGGNLGFTQLGRIEYALKGGLINTDFIDNSAGVDCSDHEVNLKILLNIEVTKKKLTETKRNALLASLTHEVAELVLHDNYEQALAMSYSAANAQRYLNLHINYLKDLETQGIVKRKVEFLPDDRTLLERKAVGEGLTRPELAVLLAYTKIYLEEEIIKTDLPEDPYLSQMVAYAFPPSIRKRYQSIMNAHRLHRNIIATQLANDVVNNMGITFVYRIQSETASTIGEIMRAYAVASRIFDTRQLQKEIAALGYQIPLSEQYEMLYNIRRLINLATRWFLHGNHLNDSLENLIKHYSTNIKKLEPIIPALMSGHTKEYLESLKNKFIKDQLPVELANRVATFRAIYTALNIIEVATENNYDLMQAAKVYFVCGERMSLVWFRDQIANDSREGHWNVLARLTLRDELDIAQQLLTIAVLNIDKKEKDMHSLFDKWATANQLRLDRWSRILEMLHASNTIEYTMFFIALRELIGLINSV